MNRAPAATSPSSGSPGPGRLAALAPSLTRRPDTELPTSGPLLGDALLAAVIALVPVVSYLQLEEVSAGWWDAPRWLGLVLIAPQFVPLAWRRTRPDAVMAAVGWSTGAYFALGYAYSFNVIGVFVALYSVSAYGARRREGLVSLAVTLVIMVWVFLSQAGDLDAILGGLAFNVFFFATAWAVGDATRSRRLLLAELHARADQAEQARELATEKAAADERARIARELHDLIAHTVSVMVVQAGAGRRVVDTAPEQTAEALGAVERTGRDALDELRRVVGVLRGGGGEDALAPLPRLAELPDLVERMRAAGVPVTLAVDGAQRALPVGVEVSLYRVVQEALTNVLKHGGRVTRVVVRLDYRGDELRVTIVDDGRGTAQPATGAGAGTVGMRERMSLLGGSLDLGPRSEGGFAVTASLPLVRDVGAGRVR